MDSRTDSQPVRRLTLTFIDAVKTSIQSWSELIDQAIPWKQFEETMYELETYQDDYPNKDGLNFSRIPETGFKVLRALFFNGLQSPLS